MDTLETAQTVPKMKRFHRSDTLDYNYYMIEGSLADIFPTTMKSPVCHTLHIHASPGVTWRMIVAEYLATDSFDAKKVRTKGGVHIEATPRQDNPVLMSVAVENEDMIVALTSVGFAKLVQSEVGFGRYEWNVQLAMLAKKLIALRDWENYSQDVYRRQQTSDSKGFPKLDKNLMDFWPKD